MTHQQATALYNAYYQKVMGKPISDRNKCRVTSVKLVGEKNDWGVLLFADQPEGEGRAWADLLDYLKEKDFPLSTRSVGLSG